MQNKPEPPEPRYRDEGINIILGIVSIAFFAVSIGVILGYTYCLNLL